MDVPTAAMVLAQIASGKVKLPSLARDLLRQCEEEPDFAARLAKLNSYETKEEVTGKLREHAEAEQ